MKRRMTLGAMLGCVGVVLFTTAPVAAQECGLVDHWIDTCPLGVDSIENQGAVIGIDFTGNCIANESYILSSCGTLEIEREAGVPHTIGTEIRNMCLELEDGSVTLVAGAGLGRNGILAPSTGTIVEQDADPLLGVSSFEVMFEVTLGDGVPLYNHTAVHVEAVIDRVPPIAHYIHPTGCTPLYDSPFPGTGVSFWNLVEADHSVNPPPPPPPTTPTISEWGLIVLVVLLLTGISIVFGRQRRAAGV